MIGRPLTLNLPGLRSGISSDSIGLTMNLPGLRLGITSASFGPGVVLFLTSPVVSVGETDDGDAVVVEEETDSVVCAEVRFATSADS